MSTIIQDEIQRVFQLQKAQQWRNKATTAAERAEKLRRLKNAVLENAELISKALHDDLRKPFETPYSSEIVAVLNGIDEAIEHLHEWMKPQAPKHSAVIPGGQFHVMYEPRGVCLLFGPWNFPFQLVLEPLVPIVAAGNCAMVKPNEMAPQTSKVTAKVIREAFGEADVAIFEGGIDLANRLLELPIDHVFFTGSPKVGRTVMAAAAKHLASVTLELGGKCPAIVDDTYDLAASAAQIGTWRCYNTGQLCLSPDHVWIRRDLRDTFLDHLGQHLRETFYINGTINKDVLGKIVDERNFDRVKGYIDDAVRRGAKVVFGGETERVDRTIHPTVLVDVPHDAAVMEDEIFGPVLPVLTYTHPDEITDFLHRRGKPLAMYIFSENDNLIDQMLANSSSGGVTINGIALHWFEMDMPFGGVNDSGIGRYHGIHGFRELSHERAIFRQTTQDK